MKNKLLGILFGGLSLLSVLATGFFIGGFITQYMLYNRAGVPDYQNPVYTIIIILVLLVIGFVAFRFFAKQSKKYLKKTKVEAKSG